MFYLMFYPSVCFRTYPTRTVIGMSFASSVLSARRLWLISRLHRKMTTSSVRIAMTTNLLPGVMAAHSHLREVWSLYSHIMCVLVPWENRHRMEKKKASYPNTSLDWNIFLQAVMVKATKMVFWFKHCKTNLCF